MRRFDVDVDLDAVVRERSAGEAEETNSISPLPVRNAGSSEAPFFHEPAGTINGEFGLGGLVARDLVVAACEADVDGALPESVAIAPVPMPTCRG